ncbi:phosphonate ABC transporter, permease protein PhnE [Rhizobium laguerreae]|uniref:phosphonate ABC transporter, permease protein PhnE n=1 Tax=Rhizobium laguerreae TaxID=1076926 RepID=UPI00143F64B7|nr:phosphonate ABC transporter, permease protein PhnE [Rhizobium laguerreae]NKM86546.1 phosphonate ABC transporter, permease protein PhnE [Rhizobium laguerreae]
MKTLDAAAMNALEARHPEIFRRFNWRHFRIPLLAVVCVVYLASAWWYFGVSKVIHDANWGIAGNYLADWVSYEIRPEISIGEDGGMSIDYPRFDPIGPNPNPLWIQSTKKTVTRTSETPTAAPSTPAAPKSNFSFMAPAPSAPKQAQAAAVTETRTEEVVTEARVTLGSGRAIDVSPDKIVLTRDGEQAVLTLDRAVGEVRAEGTLPTWVEQRTPGGRVIAFFGFSGWTDISAERVRVRRRYLGWANFIFDTNSAFFGKPAGEVIRLVTEGERLDPTQSNLSLAVNDVLYNPSWQHLDVWTKLLQTVIMAFMGTLMAMIVAFPLSFFAARNIFRNRPVNQITKRLFDFLRSVDMLIWALFFTRAFGPGPLAGISAIFFTDTGTLGKLYSEALENIDEKQREGVRSVGASPAAVQRYGVIPQIMPVFLSQALYFWESNTRSATIIGAVGAGGIGLKLWEAMRTNSDWENVAYMVLLILLVVYIFDLVSNALRSRLIGTTQG